MFVLCLLLIVVYFDVFVVTMYSTYSRLFARSITGHTALEFTMFCWVGVYLHSGSFGIL